jgi:hypothetical protein
MAEGEATRHAGGAHQRSSQQVVERGERRAPLQLGDLGGERGIERIADHGGGVEQPQRRGLGGGQLTGQCRGDRGRDRCVGRDAGMLTDGPARPRHLLEIERVAAGVRVDGCRSLPDQLGGLRLAQRCQEQRGHAPLRRGARQRGGQGPRNLTLSGRDGQQHARIRWARDERRQRVDRGRVGPMDVVEAEHQRPGVGKALEQVPQGAVRSMSVARRGLAGALAERREQRAQGVAIADLQA